MKHLNLSKKAIVLLNVFLCIIAPCSTFYLGVRNGIHNTEKGRNIAYVDSTPFMRQTYESEIKLKEKLLDFNDNIVDVSIYLGTSDDEITGANVFIESRGGIINKNELMLLISENLNLDMNNIHIESIDVEADASHKN